MPICSIAIPVYNRRNLIVRALESAFGQDVQDLEILVVDNCSTDGTWEILQSFGTRRVRLYRNERNLGLFGNLNRCLSLANGEFIHILCSDDILASGCLQRELEVMSRNPTVVLVSSRHRQRDISGRELRESCNVLEPGIYRSPEVIRAILLGMVQYATNPLNLPSGVLLRRSACVRAGEFDARLQQLGDVEYFLRVLQGGDLAVLDAVGCEVTIHSAMESIALARRGIRDKDTFEVLGRFKAAFVSDAEYRGACQYASAHAATVVLKSVARRDWAGARVHLGLCRGSKSGAGALALTLLAARIVVARKLLDFCDVRLGAVRLLG